MRARRGGQVAGLCCARQGRLAGVRWRSSSQFVASSLPRHHHRVRHARQCSQPRHVPRRPGTNTRPSHVLVPLSFNDCRDFLLQIISAGNESCVRHWTINGELKLQVPCSQTNVFNVEINDKTECHKVGSVSLCSGVTFVRFE